jgi:hypothetical protein
MRAATTLALSVLVCMTGFAGTQPGSLCVAPIPEEPPSTAGTPELFCHSGKLSLRIDGLPAVQWPQKDSFKFASLDFNRTHKVVVLCDGKAQQSFRFRFSEYKSNELCLFVNDLYQTAQLWEAKRSPWCRCK